MTHECGSEPFWRLFEDRGGIQMMPWRGEYFATEKAAVAMAAERTRLRGFECRAVRSCYVGGYPAVCGGPAAVKPSNHTADANQKVHVGQPPVGGEE